ncbi:MAG: hypothetical protein ABEJ76_00055 [Halanaeroarchaeum sp.]
MALHAVDDLTDAFDATRSFLLPFEWGTWLRLALLSLFVASSGGSVTPPNVGQFTMDSGTWTGTTPGGPPPLQFLQANAWIVVALVAVVLLVGLAFAWIGSIFEFAFYESIRREEVHVREYVGRYRSEGTRLFGFRLAFGVATAVAAGVLALAVIGPALLGLTTAPLLLLVLLAPVFAVLGVLASIVYVFTTAFVVPIMMVEDRGVVDGWRRLWGLIRGDWEQFGVFVVVGLFVMIGVGIVTGIAVAILGAVIAIPFAILFGAVVLAGLGGVSLALLAILGIPLVVLLVGVVAFVQVPVQSYLRYWALFVLGDVDDDLDVIPEQRTAVRAED